jgi:hypothetical protein
MIKRLPPISFIHLGERYPLIYVPKKAPIKEEVIRAKAEPKNTAQTFLLWAAKIKVANCVLSPNSARNTVTKTVTKSFQFILSLL